MEETFQGQTFKVKEKKPLRKKLLLALIIILSKFAMRPAAESYQKQKQFVTDANHELKTPLTLILTNIDIAEAELGQNEWLDDIRNEGERMSKLVNRLVTLSRMDEEKVFELVADTVTVEITDRATGKVYRRELPIDYFENANFLRLSGENLDGSLSQLVFYTPRGIERVKDVSGKGPDHDRCGGHSH